MTHTLLVYNAQLHMLHFYCIRLYCSLSILCTACTCQLIIKENDDDDDVEDQKSTTD